MSPAIPWPLLATVTAAVLPEQRPKLIAERAIALAAHVRAYPDTHTRHARAVRPITCTD